MERLTGALALVATLAVVPGCGGGMPLWYGPAQVRRGDTHFGAGVSSTFPIGGTHAAIRGAQAIESAGRAPAAVESGSLKGNPAFTPGALAEAGSAPGLAPGVMARVGLGAQLEAGILYTGRSGRLDLRRNFDLKDGKSFSIGLAGYTHLYGQPANRSLPSVATQDVRGYGGEIPALLGTISEDGNFGIWGGLRAGGEWLKLDRVTSEPKDVTFGANPVRLQASRFFVGPTVGGMVGYKIFHLMAELMASFETIQGSYGDVHGTVRGVALTPSTALVFDF